MDISFSKRGLNLLVNIDGEIDHHTSEIIKRNVEKEFKRLNAKNIIFNFENVDFMDSSGIGMVIGRYKNISSLGGRVVIYGMNPSVYRIFYISGLYKIIESYKSMSEALNTF